MSYKDAVRYEFRNKHTLPAIQGAGIPVLPVWQLTAGTSRHHPGLYGLNSADCTHFCMHNGSVLESWVTMLQNLLGSLTTHCNGREPFQECLLTAVGEVESDTLLDNMIV